MRIAVYVCPTEGCNDYIGYGDMPDLEGSGNIVRGRNWEVRPVEVQHTRADCPTCRINGKGRVQRRRVEFEIERPAPVGELASLTP